MDIRLEGISKKFSDTYVLKDISLTFKEGCINGIMGPSGVGKTTILNILMGIIKPDSGKVIGVDRRRIAAVFQEDRLIEHWDAVSNVKLVCDRTVTRNMIEQELYQVGLGDHMDKPVSKLSGGMRRRVAIARAMLAQSEIILMDEPFKGLDEVCKRKVMDYVAKKTQGKTVILVTHDREEITVLGGNLVVI